MAKTILDLIASKLPEKKNDYPHQGESRMLKEKIIQAIRQEEGLEWSDMSDGFQDLMERQAQAILDLIAKENTYEAISDFVYWHEKANKTPEMLLSSRHEKSDECAEIMNNYDKAINRLKEINNEKV